MLLGVDFCVERYQYIVSNFVYFTTSESETAVCFVELLIVVQSILTLLN